MGTQSSSHRLAVGLFLVAAFASPLLYSAYTGHIWEDYFITFKHSQNLCEGHGLVFYPGERVHGFTSPLGTLLPAFCYWATGSADYLPALWLFRILSAVAFADGGLLFLMALRAGGAGRMVQVAFALLYLLDAKAVDFSGNGMETAFMLLFLGWAMYLVVRDDPRQWLAVGLAWAGLMWTRPDSCVYVAALALAGFLFATGPRRPRLAALLKSAAVCAAVYLPWFAWAWSYYGSPVPNTIRAKSTYGGGYGSLSETVQDTLGRVPARLADVFQPTYYGHGGWPEWVGTVALGLGIFAAACWLLPLRDRLTRLMSFCFFLLVVYLAFLIAACPWYLPPAEVCGLLVLTAGAAALARLVPGNLRAVWGVLGVGFALLIGFSAWMVLMTAREFEVQQREIEWGNRKRVADWLKDHVGPGERVYAECLGYFGYFSGARMLDYPGLVSPEVVAAMRRGGNFATAALELKPEWMALRPGEVMALDQYEEFGKQYEAVEKFDVTEQLATHPDLLGMGYLRGDAKFTVFRRMRAQDSSQSSSP